MGIARLGSIALDWAEPATLAAFWAELLGGEIAFTSDAFVAVKTDRVWLPTVLVEHYEPPSWPDGGVPKQMHIDLVDDLDQAEAEAVRLGAERAASQLSPDRWRVLLDPAGHPFCISTQIPSENWLGRSSAHCLDVAGANASGRLRVVPAGAAAGTRPRDAERGKPEYRNLMGAGNPFAAELEALPDATDRERLAAFMGRQPCQQ